MYETHWENKLFKKFWPAPLRPSSIFWHSKIIRMTSLQKSNVGEDSSNGWNNQVRRVILLFLFLSLPISVPHSTLYICFFISLEQFISSPAISYFFSHPLRLSSLFLLSTTVFYFLLKFCSFSCILKKIYIVLFMRIFFLFIPAFF